MSAERNLLVAVRALLHDCGMKLDERATADITIPLSDGGVLHVPVQGLMAARDAD